jgi:hypothetical protein
MTLSKMIMTAIYLGTMIRSSGQYNIEIVLPFTWITSCMFPNSAQLIIHN